MSVPDLNLLIALDALLASGSVAGAARRLGLSTSAMSRTLTRLRDTTGDALLVRAGRQMVLTPYAEALRDRARTAVEDARAVLQPPPTTLDLAALQRVFTLRANDGFIEAFGPRLIAAVAQVAPGVQLRFAAKPQKTAAPLREGEADLEIGVLNAMGPEVRVQALFRDHFVGVVRAGHPLARPREVTAQDYVAHGHVVASRHARDHGPVDDALARLGLRRRIVAVVPGFPAAVAVARASDLIALVPASYAASQGTADAASLHAFRLPVPLAGITVSQMWHPRLRGDAAHRWLRELVLTQCREP
ncbi:LysR family transcriptional regulator [Pseudoxanthomonas winnipegensis]|uniref:LysR family transcriptional regulator n=1 Tax=Pseudoxanthomonas winnipegensis TaxID=2480810 RepID=A0A4Q8LTG7_9GAMM|nr:LysR family transcriptional regulator [Pseudoxanthomonas winnipegensis]RZZ88358.1 LysR family transcriptional regulator [Pseudoxanthomonas winnipegensis]TAA34644.1 LysR family transcriptional regulator [Pseudoxanthomonas winnipegensis]